MREKLPYHVRRRRSEWSGWVLVSYKPGSKSEPTDATSLARAMGVEPQHVSPLVRNVDRARLVELECARVRFTPQPDAHDAVRPSTQAGCEVDRTLRPIVSLAST